MGSELPEVQLGAPDGTETLARWHSAHLLIGSVPRKPSVVANNLHCSPRSIFWTAKDMLGLANHGARELHTLRYSRRDEVLALTVAIALNHRLGRPPAGRRRGRRRCFGTVARLEKDVTRLPGARSRR